MAARCGVRVHSWWPLGQTSHLGRPACVVHKSRFACCCKGGRMGGARRPLIQAMDEHGARLAVRPTPTSRSGSAVNRFHASSGLPGGSGRGGGAAAGPPAGVRALYQVWPTPRGVEGRGSGAREGLAACTGARQRGAVARTAGRQGGARQPAGHLAVVRPCSRAPLTGTAHLSPLSHCPRLSTSCAHARSSTSCITGC